jgi:hypothetical protein
MHRFVRTLAVLAMSASLVACSTMRVLSLGPQASVEALKRSPALGNPKDSVVVVSTDGIRHEMRLTSVNTEAVEGTSLDQKQPIRVPVSQIQRVEVIDTNSRTVVTVVLVVLAVAVVAALATANSVGSSIVALVP